MSRSDPHMRHCDLRADDPGISSCSPTTSSTASAAWARACRCRSPRTAAASSGSRTRARRRISPASTSPTRASRRSSCRPTCRKRTCARTRSRSSGDIMAVAYQTPEGRARSRRASSCSTSRCPRSRSRSRSSIARARIRAACTSSGSATANTCTWRPARRTSSRRIRSTTSSTALRRAQSVEAGRGRPLVDAGHARGRQRRRRRRATSALDMGFRAHNTNVYPQRPDRCYLGYIDGGMFILDISDKAQPKPICALGQLAALSPASRTPCCRCSSASLLVVTDESTDGRRRATGRS